MNSEVALAFRHLWDNAQPPHSHTLLTKGRGGAAKISGKNLLVTAFTY